MTKDLGQLSSELYDLKSKKKALNTEISVLNRDIKLVEADLLHTMNEQSLLKLADDHHTVYVARQLVPKVVNWDLFYEYIRENNYFHMLEKRPSRTAYRESFELGQAVPGIDPVQFDEVRTRKT
jgi:hypothetical protein